MLEQLKFQNVGPAKRLEVTFQERLNILAGDNGLGKTFLLDTAWWALTRTWARGIAVPHLPPAVGRIGYQFGTKSGRNTAFESQFDRADEKWSVKASRPGSPGLVIYAQVDGGFSVWDPARNYWKKDQPDRPPSFPFSADEVWEGNTRCEGLIRDWASWQREDAEAFAQLKRVLEIVSPSGEEPLEPGDLRKVFLNDPRRHPTLKTAYGQEVPLIHASAGVRRIVALAYLLVWTWQEHLEAAALLGQAPTTEIIFLIDEIEAHLHPQWQRRIVPALLQVMDALTGDHEVAVQLITATHSPMVLASVEPDFDEDRDGVFLLELEGGEVTLKHLAWSKQGDVVNWLVSDAFGLEQGRSLEAEQAIEAAEAWMRGDRASLLDGMNSEKSIDTELKRVLAGHDHFWPRWVVWAASNGAGATADA